MTPESLTIHQVTNLIKETFEDIREAAGSETCPVKILNEGVSRGEIEEQIFVFSWKCADFGIFDPGNEALDAKVTPAERKMVIEALAELNLALDECLDVFDNEKTNDKDIQRLRRAWRRIENGLNMEVLYRLPKERRYQVRGTLGPQLHWYSRNLDELEESDLRRSSCPGPGSDGGSVVLDDSSEYSNTS